MTSSSHADDFYDVIGVKSTATQDEIKAAFKKLAAKCHPDRFPDDIEKKAAEERFKRLNNAYQVLSDQHKRARYDSGEELIVENTWNHFSVDDLFSSHFGSAFDDLFNVHRQRRRQRVPEKRDVTLHIDVALEDIVLEKNVELIIDWHKLCDKCSGTGAQSLERCKRCGGSGSEVYGRGFVTVEQMCRSCSGFGERQSDVCQECNGFCLVKDDEKKISLKIARGTIDGQTLKLTGCGLPGHDGRGDAFIVVRIKHDSVFRVSGQDIVRDINVGFSKLALGDSIKTKWIDGSDVTVKIDSGAQHDDELRFKNMGYSKNGDFVVRLKTTIPRSFSEKAKELFRELDNELKTIDDEDSV